MLYSLGADASAPAGPLTLGSTSLKTTTISWAVPLPVAGLLLPMPSAVAGPTLIPPRPGTSFLSACSALGLLLSGMLRRLPTALAPSLYLLTFKCGALRDFYEVMGALSE